MAAVVKIPVVGKVDQRLVYAGGAAVVGIVGYAWWSGAGQAEPTLIPEPETDYEPPTVVDSNIGGGGLDEPTPGLPQTNVEWLTMARETGAALGFAQSLLDAALPKYLGKQPISPAEAAAVAAIIAVIGSPPSGSFPLIPTLPPTPPPHTPPTTPPTKPPASGKAPKTPPGFVTASSPHPGQVWVRFIHVPGATGYQWRWETKGGMSPWHRYPRQSANGFGIVKAGAPRGVTVAIRIAAYNAHGVGPYAKTRNVNVRR